MSRRTILLASAGVGLALMAVPVWADRECFDPVCKAPTVIDPAPPVASRAPAQQIPVAVAASNVVDVSAAIAEVDAGTAGPTAQEQVARATAPRPSEPRAAEPRAAEPKVYDSVEYVRDPAPVLEPAAPPRDQPKVYDTVEYVRDPAPREAASRPNRNAPKVYDTIEYVRDPVPPKKNELRQKPPAPAPVPAKPSRPVEARTQVVVVDQAPPRPQQIRDAQELSRPLYVDDRPVRIVEQGPVYASARGPSYVVNQGPVPSVAVSGQRYADGYGQGYGYGYDNVVVVAHPDPTVRHCQVDTRRGYQNVLCGPNSYRPYGEPGYRPLGTYQPQQAPAYVQVAPDPRIIRIEQVR